MVSSASFEFEFCDVFRTCVLRESVVYTKNKKGETGCILSEPDIFTFKYCINKVNFLNKFHYLEQIIILIIIIVNNNNNNSNNYNSFITYFVVSLKITCCIHFLLVGRCISCPLPFVLLMGLKSILYSFGTKFISLMALNYVH